MKDYLKIFAVFSAFALIIPCLVFIYPASFDENISGKESAISSINYVNIGEEKIPVDEYITGCVLAQMPYTFHQQALMVQAVICRTLVYYNVLKNGEKSDFSSLQSYYSPQKAEEVFGNSYDKAYERVYGCVEATKGVILTYEDLPIVTAFHPVSSGVTESSMDIFGEDIPYLASVESEADKNAENYKQEVSISKAEVFARLCAYFKVSEKGEFSLDIKSKAKNGTVTSFEFDSNGTKKEIAGKDFCRIFGLNSCNLTINEKDDYFEITCFGAGSLVGLSQYGANAMAQNGDNFEKILTHYFSGVCLTEVSKPAK